jgi:ankyrin repeat protein
MRNNKRLNLALIWTVMVCISGCSQQPLSYATINESAAKGDLADVKRHLKRGAALNAVDVIGNTPLMCAAENGQLDVVQYLVSQGAEIDATNQMVTDEGLLTGRRNLNGCTPLMYASMNGHRKIVQYLLTKGANVSAVDGGGQSALWHALESNHMAVVGYLVDNGANVNAKNHKGRTPLWHALEQGQQDVAVDLVKLGADIVTSDKGGDTPLWYAARRGYRDVANLIGEKVAENGTDIGARFLLRRLVELNVQSENSRDRFPPEYEPLMQAMEIGRAHV